MSAQRLGILLSNLAGVDVEETLAPVSENDVWMVVAAVVNILGRVRHALFKIPGRFRACLIQTSPKPTRNFDSLEPYPDLDEGGPEPVRPDTDAQPVNKKVTKKTSLLCSYVALSRARARQSPCTMRGTSRCGCGEKVCLIEVSVCRVVGDPRGIRAGSARDPRGIRGQNAGSVALGYAKTEAFRGIRRIRIPLL